MIELSVSLASNGVVKVPGYEQLVRFGYTKNRGVYRLAVTAAGEWEGLIIRAFWHLPGGGAPASTLVQNGTMAVPASVTAQPGNGCVTFEGSDGTRTVTSADLRYRVAANSGTEDGTEPEPGTPAWQQLVDAVHTDATAAEQAKTDAQTAAQQAGAAAQKAGQALSDTVDAKEDALVAIGTAQETATQAVDTARDKALKQVEASTKAADTAASQAAASAGNADRSAQAAAGSLQALKNGIASGDFKGEPGTSPTVTVQDITGGHRIVITDATGTSSVDVLNGKQGDPGKPGDTGATPELTIGTVKEGDAPSATITGTVKKPILNLTLKSGAPGKDATVDDTLSQSGKAADAKVTGDALATKAVIDDTTVGPDAWSSKHIVDMLCPPIEEAGNPVQCYPVAGYPLGCKVSWEPTQEGSGTPSPENIRPIKGRDSVSITHTGKNIIPYPYERIKKVGDSYTESGITYTLLNDGAIHFAGIPKSAFGMTIARNNLSRFGKLVTSGKIFYDSNNNQTFIYPFKLGEKVSETVYPQIEVGTTATSYEAPMGHRITTLTLPRTIYGGTVDAVTGEGQETWKLATLDGTENWETWGVNKNNAAVTGFYTYSINDYDPNGNKLLCSTMPHKIVDVWGGRNEGVGYASALDQSRRYMIYSVKTDTLSDASDNASAVASFKSYLATQYAAGTPVQIAYRLAEPVPFTATGAQPIPALPGVNTLLTDADSVTVTGRADPIKRITDLEDAVASMT